MAAAMAQAGTARRAPADMTERLRYRTGSNALQAAGTFRRFDAHELIDRQQ